MEYWLYLLIWLNNDLYYVFLPDGYFYHMMRQCRYSSKDLQGIELITSYVFNQAEYIRFNSTVGKYVGYTEYGVKNAEAWNKGPELAGELGELERVCKHNAPIDYSAILDKTGEQGSLPPLSSDWGRHLLFHSEWCYIEICLMKIMVEIN